jgi:protein-tyrosine phosphatase
VTGSPLVPGAMNFRDTGGLLAGAARTRPGMLYRSGNLARLDDTGVAALGSLGIRRIIDLRADDEVMHEPSRVPSQVQTTRVPLFLGSVASFFAEDIGLAEMYRRIIEYSAAGLVDVVRGVITDQPVLVHCTVGKDRTGVTIAVALAAAGVERDAVVADYARTESLLPVERNRQVVAYLRSLHPEARHLEDLATRSPASVMRELLDDVDARYGSAADYLRAHGMTDDEVTELRRVLLTAPE